MVSVLYYAITITPKTYRLKEPNIYYLTVSVAQKPRSGWALAQASYKATVEVTPGAAGSSRLDEGRGHFWAHSCSSWRPPFPAGIWSEPPPVPCRVGLSMVQPTTWQPLPSEWARQNKQNRRGVFCNLILELTSYHFCCYLLCKKRVTICTPMFTAAWLTKPKRWRQLKCLSTDEWIHKMWYQCTMEYYSALTKKEGNSDIRYNTDELWRHTIREPSQSQKDKYCIIPFIWGI